MSILKAKIKKVDWMQLTRDTDNETEYFPARKDFNKKMSKNVLKSLEE